MKRTSLLLVAVITAAAAAAQTPDSPHWMVGPDGEPDPEKCAVCHAEDMSLLQSKSETCAFCHTEFPHPGAERHARTDAAAVARLLPPEGPDAPSLPLTEDGKIYCGTCHFFHDPRVMGDEWLDQAWVPSGSGLSQIIRQAVQARWDALAERAGRDEPLAHFSPKGTRALRLPIRDGTLCRHCHRDLP